MNKRYAMVTTGLDMGASFEATTHTIEIPPGFLIERGKFALHVDRDEVIRDKGVLRHYKQRFAEMLKQRGGKCVGCPRATLEEKDDYRSYAFVFEAYCRNYYSGCDNLTKEEEEQAINKLNRSSAQVVEASPVIVKEEPTFTPKKAPGQYGSW